MTPEEFDRLHEQAHQPWKIGPAAAPEVAIFPPVIVSGDDDRQTAGRLLSAWLLGQVGDGPFGQRVRTALRDGKVSATLDEGTGLLVVSAPDLGILGRASRDMFSAKLTSDAMKSLGVPPAKVTRLLQRLRGGAS